MNTLPNSLTYTGIHIAGLVAVAMESGDDLATAVASAEDRMKFTTNGVVVQGLSDEAISKLRRVGCDVKTAGDMSHVTANLEFAAKSRTAAKKKSAAAPEVRKRLSAEEKRKQQVEGESLKHLTTPQSMSMVKRIWQQLIESEDFKLFPLFIKELDRLIAEYRVHVGTDQMPEMNLPDDEDETDDHEDDATVASADQSSLDLNNPAVEELEKRDKHSEAA